MPATENDRRNQQKVILEKPSFPDHDRTQERGMHSAFPGELRERIESPNSKFIEFDEVQSAPPDQEFTQVLHSGASVNQGRIHEDPNNWLTSDHDDWDAEKDPENRGESLPDYIEGDKH